MATLLKIELSGLPPTVNHLYRTSRTGVRYKTPQGRDWQNVTASIIAAGRKGRKPYSGDVALSVVFHVADKRRWDLDNRLKALQDCLSMAGIIEDDRQIQRLLVERKRGKLNATEVSLVEMPEEKRE